MSVHIGIRSLLFVKQEHESVEVNIFPYTNIASFIYDPISQKIFIKKLGDEKTYDFSFNTSHYNLLIQRLKEC